MKDNRKPIPTTITVFGAGGRLGGPLARFVSAHSPGVRLRLITSTPDKCPPLQRTFPRAEIVLADYLDESSMHRALAGSNGVFLVTPNFLDEEKAMAIFARAAHGAHTVTHIVRILGDPPGMTLERIPAALHEFRGGTAVQHLHARRALDATGLPVTYLNVAAYLMDNFINIGRPLREQRKLIMPHDRFMAFIDPRDVAEAAARLLLSDNHRHIGQYYHIDNGHDLMRFSAVAHMMSEVFGVPIAYDGTPETFLRELGPRYRQRMGNERAGEYFVRYFEFEHDNEVAWRRTDFCETVLERKPRTLKAWLTEHRQILMPPDGAIST